MTGARAAALALMPLAAIASLGCELIAGIRDISWSPGLVEAGAPSDTAESAASSPMLDDGGETGDLGAVGPMNGDEGASNDMTPADGSTEASTPNSSEASTLAESASTDSAALSDAAEPSDASIDISAPPADAQSEVVACGVGTPLIRTTWATNPGTSASDNVCGIYNMFDGNLATRWSTNRLQMITPAEWVEIDLGCMQTFSELVLDATNDGTDYPRGYTVQVSTDGSTWTQVAKGTASAALAAIAFASTTARYVRVNQTGTAASNFWSIDELNICGTTSGICGGSPVSYPRDGWATNPGTAASDNSTAIGNMFDGSINTRWTPNRLQAASPSEWVEVDMGTSQPVSQVVLESFADCNDYPRGYAVQLSIDGATWMPWASGAGSSPFTNITSPSTTACYIKITQTGMSSANYWSIDELDVLH